MLCPRARGLLATSNLDLGAIICLANRERKQVKSLSGQNRITRCELIETDPSIANPDHPGGTLSVTWAFAPNSPRSLKILIPSPLDSCRASASTLDIQS